MHVSPCGMWLWVLSQEGVHIHHHCAHSRPEAPITDCAEGAAETAALAPTTAAAATPAAAARGLDVHRPPY